MQNEIYEPPNPVLIPDPEIRLMPSHQLSQSIENNAGLRKSKPRPIKTTQKLEAATPNLAGIARKTAKSPRLAFLGGS
jgi:hypothetical protein